jgi:hypothetical protein
VAFVERFIQTLQQQVLDYSIVFGPKHMDYLVSEAVTYYHEERPHQAKGNVALVPVAGKPAKEKEAKGASSTQAELASEIDCRLRLGGRLKHYYRKVA